MGRSIGSDVAVVVVARSNSLAALGKCIATQPHLLLDKRIHSALSYFLARLSSSHRWFDVRERHCTRMMHIAAGPSMVLGFVPARLREGAGIRTPACSHRNRKLI
jgi:hypothetical protein